VKVEVTEADGLLRKLFIKIPAERVKSEEDKQFSDFRKKVSLKGFRKGKAPMEMIKSLYGNEVKAMVADEVIKATYPEAVKESTLKVASYVNITELKFTEEGGLAYTAEVEVFPEISNVVYDGLELKTSEIDIPDEAVEEIVSFYRVRFSDTRPIAREVQSQDVVVVDLNKLSDPNKVMKETAFTDVQIDLARELTVKEFKEQLPGMKAGEEREITVSYPDDYPDERFAGSSITYRCRVREVRERILPEFNDELAKRSGQAETALELRMKIREELTQEKRDIERNAHKREVIRHICKKNEIPIPQAMIDDYLDAVVKDITKSFPESKEEDIRREYREPGINSIRWNILYHRLAEQEGIEVLPWDTENWIKNFAESSSIPEEKAREVLRQSGRTDSVRESILEKKVLDFLIEGAKKTPEPS
jgi:trigger factor